MFILHFCFTSGWTAPWQKILNPSGRSIIRNNEKQQLNKELCNFI